MGYFGALSGLCFKRNDKGQLIFYPAGRLGKGYLIDDQNKETEIKRFIGRYYKIVIPLCIILAIAVGLYAFLAVPFMYLYYRHNIKRFAAGLEEIDEKYSGSENIKTFAEQMGKSTARKMLWGSIILWLGSFGVFFEVNKIMGIFCVIFFGCCTVISYKIVRCADQRPERTFKGQNK